jgi:hypothetical protein
LAVFFTVSNSIAFLPVFGAGALADLFGITAILLGTGVVLMIAALWQLILGTRRA